MGRKTKQKPPKREEAMFAKDRWPKVGALVLLIFLWALPVIAEQEIEVGIGGKPDIIQSEAEFAGRQNGQAEAIRNKLGPGWTATRSFATGRISVLRGPGTDVYPGGPEKAAKAFINDLRVELNLSTEDDVRVLKVGRSAGRVHVRLQQTFRGVAVEGAHILVHMTPDGSVTMVQNGSIPLASLANEAAISEENAIETALAGLRERLGEAAFLDDPTCELVIALFEGQYWYAWKITVPTDNPLGLWVTYLDAQGGEVLEQYDAIISLKKGAGTVFKTNEDALIWKSSNTTLKNLFKEDETIYEYGYPIGKAAFVGQTDGSDVFEGDAYAPDHKFFFDPQTNPDAFDEVTTYYHLDKTHAWWSKKVIQDQKNRFLIEYFNTGPLPAAAVNRTGICNAYYTSALPGWGTPGWIFYNENECWPGSRDFTHDTGIIYHEFTHAIEHWTGSLLLYGPPHRYPRSMGEGDADYFSYVQRKNPLIGEVMDPGGEREFLRDLSGKLSGQRLYPDDVDWPEWDAPEEHWTGEIWGQFLWDLRALLKASTDRYIWKTNAFYLINEGGHDSSYVDFFDWSVAFLNMLVDEKPFGEAMSGKKLLKTFIKAYPAFTDRGIFTTDGYDGVRTDNTAWFFFYIYGKSKMKFKGKLCAANSNPSSGGNPSEYFFNFQYPATKIVAQVKGGKTGLTLPEVQLRNAWTDEVYVPDLSKSAFNLAQIEFLNLPAGTLGTPLVVDVFSNGGNTGAYTLTVSSK
jgi:hypothetical protein